MKIFLIVAILLIFLGCKSTRRPVSFPTEDESWLKTNDSNVPNSKSNSRLYRSSANYIPPVEDNEKYNTKDRDANNEDAVEQEKPKPNGVKPQSYARSCEVEDHSEVIAEESDNIFQDNYSPETTREIPIKNKVVQDTQQRDKPQEETKSLEDVYKTGSPKEKLRYTLQKIDEHIEQSKSKGWNRFDYENVYTDFLSDGLENHLDTPQTEQRTK